MSDRQDPVRGDAMLHAVRPSSELPGSLAPYGAPTTNPVPPAADGYELVDSAPMLAAVATGAISAVLVLPRVDEALRLAGPAAWCTGLRNAI